jgi:dCMP deaminase
MFQTTRGGTLDTMASNIDWHARFIQLARHIAQWSKDPSTKVGCVVVGQNRQIMSTGYNGFPRGVADTVERLSDRAVKYPMIVHAEENAVAQAARVGVSLNGCTLYVTFPPCTRCARSLIQSGIARVHYPLVPIPDRWREDVERSLAMLTEAGVLSIGTALDGG